MAEKHCFIVPLEIHTVTAVSVEAVQDNWKDTQGTYVLPLGTKASAKYFSMNINFNISVKYW